jgi:hypothetical protein
MKGGSIASDSVVSLVDDKTFESMNKMFDNAVGGGCNCNKTRCSHRGGSLFKMLGSSTMEAFQSNSKNVAKIGGSRSSGSKNSKKKVEGKKKVVVKGAKKGGFFGDADVAQNTAKHVNAGVAQNTAKHMNASVAHTQNAAKSVNAGVAPAQNTAKHVNAGVAHSQNSTALKGGFTNSAAATNAKAPNTLSMLNSASTKAAANAIQSLNASAKALAATAATSAKGVNVAQAMNSMAKVANVNHALNANAKAFNASTTGVNSGPKTPNASHMSAGSQRSNKSKRGGSNSGMRANTQMTMSQMLQSNSGNYNVKNRQSGGNNVTINPVLDFSKLSFTPKTIPVSGANDVLAQEAVYSPSLIEKTTSYGDVTGNQSSSFSYGQSTKLPLSPIEGSIKAGLTGGAKRKVTVKKAVKKAAKKTVTKSGKKVAFKKPTSKPASKKTQRRR